MTISAAELDAIEGRANSATPGPWKAYVEGRDHVSGSSFIKTGLDETRGSDIELTGATTHDYDFIANARQDIVRLVSEVRELLQRLEESRS